MIVVCRHVFFDPTLCKEVLSAMKGCKIFHFAGHTFAAFYVTVSGLILSDDRLTINSLFDINLRQDKLFLAYLSAYRTGKVEHWKMLDERLHLIGAFQLAGFRHVIGTIWKVNDESCVDIARMTYEWMQTHGLSDSSVSEGLHPQSLDQRAQNESSLQMWYKTQIGPLAPCYARASMLVSILNLILTSKRLRSRNNKAQFSHTDLFENDAGHNDKLYQLNECYCRRTGIIHKFIGLMP